MATTRISVCFRRWQRMGLVLVLISVFYFVSWKFRRQLGLIQPMANVAYYHYGGKPNSFLDRAFYFLYYPLYLCGDRYGLHWRDRADPYDPSYF